MKTNLNILMLATEYPPAPGFGLARYASELAATLVELGNEVHVLTCNYDQGQPDYWHDGVRVHDLTELIPVRHYDWVGETVLNNLWLLERGLEIADKSGPFDVIISHDWLACQTAKSLRSSLNIPWILIMHDTESGKRHGNLNPHQVYIAEMEAWSLSHADHIFTNSKFMAKELQRLYQAPKSSIKVIPCGVNTDRFKSKTDLDDFRSLFARNGEKIIFYAGRMSPMKGVEDLLEAFEILVENDNHIRLVLAGDGVLKQPLQKKTNQLGLSQPVLFTGTLGDKALGAFYQVADCVVVPSRYEPFGMTAIEAAACGAKVVASKTGGLKEIINASQGFISGIPSQKPSALARAISRCLENSNKKPGFDTSHYSWKSTAKQLIDSLGAIK